MKLHRLFIAISFALSPTILEAQGISIGNDDNRPIEERIIYSHETTFHATLHSRGLGFGYKSGRIRGIDKTTNWNFEAMYYRSQKQIKLAYLFSSNTFVYGKLNDMVAIRGGYEVEHTIYGKPYWGGVELRWLYEAGVSLALLKPYYYAVLVSVPNALGQLEQKVEYHVFDENTQGSIVGKAPLKYGLTEIKPRPGIYVKGGLSFEIGSRSTYAQYIEAGAVVEYFPQGVALMANNPKEYVLINLYVSYSWGSRFNK